MRATEAKKFVTQHSNEYLENKIDQFPYRDAKSNPAGLLAESIRRDIPPPPNYLPQIDRLKQEKLDKNEHKNEQN